MKKVLLLLMLSSSTYGAAFAQWGVASTHPGTSNVSSVKFVEFGKSGEEGKLAYMLGVGGWHDGSGYVGGTGFTTKTIDTPNFKMKGGEWQAKASDSLFVEALFGVEPKSDHFYMSYKLGPAIITNTDALLGSNAQLSHEFGFGMRDLRDVRVGLVLKHYSNAGLVKPNKGRDFIGARIEW